MGHTGAWSKMGHMSMMGRKGASSSKSPEGAQPNELGLGFGKVGGSCGKLRVAIGPTNEGGLLDQWVGTSSEEVTLVEESITMKSMSRRAEMSHTGSMRRKRWGQSRSSGYGRGTGRAGTGSSSGSRTVTESHPRGLMGGVGLEKSRSRLHGIASRACCCRAHWRVGSGHTASGSLGRNSGMVPSHLPMAEGEKVGVAHTRHGIEADAEAKAHGGVGVLPIGGGRRRGGRGSSRRGIHPRSATEMLRSHPTGIGHGTAVAHVDHEVGPIADEVFVVEGPRSAAARVPAEAPSVQLPHERFVLARLEVSR